MKPIERLRKLNTIENLWLYILLILKEGPHYGWEMPKLIEKKFGFKPGRITPYRVLYQLAFQGLVQGRIERKKKDLSDHPKGRRRVKRSKNFLRENFKKNERMKRKKNKEKK